MTHDYGATCACPERLDLTEDLKTCIRFDYLLLTTRREGILRMSLAPGHAIRAIPIKISEEASDIDFDFNDNRIYWTAKETQVSRCYFP